jgi:hypothetical protein
LNTLFAALASLPKLACRRLWRVPSQESVALVPSRECSAPWYFREGRCRVQRAFHVDARKIPTCTTDMTQGVQPCPLHPPRRHSLGRLGFSLPTLSVLGGFVKRTTCHSVSGSLLLKGIFRPVFLGFSKIQLILTRVFISRFLVFFNDLFNDLYVAIAFLFQNDISDLG